MTRFWTQLCIEHRLFLRDRSVVAFHVLLPIVLLVLLTQVHANMLGLRWTVGVVTHDGSPAPSRIVQGLRAVPGLQVVEGAAAKLRLLASQGRVGALVVLPPGFPHAAEAVAVEGDSQTGTIVRGLLEGLLAVEPNASPRVVGPGALRGLMSAESAFASVLLPGVVGMVVASVALFGFGAGLAGLRQRGFLARLAVTPLGVRQFLLVQCVHRLLFILTEAALLVLVGRLLVGGAPRVAPVALLAVVTSGALAFLGIGFVVGGRSSSGEAASGWCHLLFFPMLLLSGAFYPVAALPGVMRLLSPFLPMTYLLDGLQRALSGVGSVAMDVTVLLLVGVALLVVSAGSFSAE